MTGIGFFNETTFVAKSDTSLIKENITRILLTSPGERPNNYSFGSLLKSYLFNIENIMQEEVNNEITRAVHRWEPRITISNISTKRPDASTFSITLKCQINETLEEFEYESLIRL